MAIEAVRIMGQKQQAAKTRNSGKILLALVGAFVLASGAAITGYVVARAHRTDVATVDPSRPALQIRTGGRSAPSGDATAIDPRIYKPSYVTLGEPLTSNLRGSDAIIQVGLGIGTFYDQKVLDNLKDNETAIRSLVLVTLADQDETNLMTPEGKQHLKVRLRDEINSFLMQHTGYGGVEGVYFTSLIMQ